MTDLIGKTLGQYEITEKIGQGGMATVFRAHQPSMHRDVAIKVISGQLTGNDEFIARFEHEARLIAHLEHAHILPVYDFGREGEMVYLAMRLVEGGSLDQQLRKGPLALPLTAKMIGQIASALDYAHSEGVIHRDLKPNNILLDKSGIPYLTDFGIAKMVKSSVALTATGMVMGTPSYMAPEQWRGENVDARTDIYALGVMLYEMLTGELPFTGDTPFILMYKHFDQQPPAPNRIVPGLPDGVTNIINRAMAKNPLDRFASASQLADELNVVVTETVLPATKPVSSADNVRTVVGMDNLNTAVGTVPGTIAAPTEQGNTALPTSTIITKPAENTNITAKPRSSRRLLIGAGVICILALLAVGAFLLLRHPAYQQLAKFEGHTNWVQAVVWTKDGKEVITGSADKTLRIWNAETGETVKTLRGHTDSITDALWSPDGSTLATVGEDQSVRLWDIDTGTNKQTFTVCQYGAQNISWSPDGSKIAIACVSEKVVIQPINGDKPTLTLPLPIISFLPVAWSPNGKIIATGGENNSVQLWNAENGILIGSFPGHTEAVAHLAWNSDGSRLLSTSYDGTVRTWDMTTGKALPLLTMNASLGSGVGYAAWSPDNRQIATVSAFINLGGKNDMTIKIWDAENGSLLATMEAGDEPVDSVAWSPDGSKLASAGLDQTVRIWSMR